MTTTTTTIKRKIAGRIFSVEIPAQHDPEYGVTASTKDAARAELEIAAQLALEGPIKPDAFRFMRGTIGMASKDLAVLLNVSPGTVSRWENGERDIDTLAWLALGSLVRERAGLPPLSAERMRRIADGVKPAREVRVDFSRLTATIAAHLAQVGVASGVAERVVALLQIHETRIEGVQVDEVTSVASEKGKTARTRQPKTAR